MSADIQSGYKFTVSTHCRELVKRCWSYVPSLSTEFLKQVERLCVVWDENDLVGRRRLDHCEEIVQHLDFTWDRHTSQRPSENSTINDELHVHPAGRLITHRCRPYRFFWKKSANILERRFIYGAYFMKLANYVSFAQNSYGTCNLWLQLTPGMHTGLNYSLALRHGEPSSSKSTIR